MKLTKGQQYAFSWPDKVKSFIAPLLFVLIFSSCSDHDTELIIFHAGSLSVPFQELADLYERQNPDIDVKLESDGSIACARKITELNRQADIMASADIRIIEEFLVPGYTDTAIAFTNNEMVLAFHEKSTSRNSINKQNWHKILLQENVKYGRSNPDIDPCGYRSILSMKLQEKYFSSEHFVKKLRNKDKKYIRPKETDLLALLETHTIDYIFIYKSVARQHNLQWITLSDTVNLSKASLKNLYNKAKVKIRGNSPGDTLEIKGNPMVYGYCVLKNAPNPDNAQKFLNLLHSRQGQEIIH
ncbi:MAG: tungstate ABC transporter substrate-binding protein WtpA [Bacteroidales bacterium]